MANKLIKQQLNGITLLYPTRDEITSFTCVPTAKEKDVLEHRLFKTDSVLYGFVDPSIQIALSGDGLQRDFSAGYTLFNSDTALSLRFKEQKREENEQEIIIKTVFDNKLGLKVTQIIKQVKPFEAFETSVLVENQGEDIEIEKLSSFMIDCLSPFQNKNDTSSIKIHELKNYWSNEGRLKTQTLKDLEFEDSWAALGLKVEKIGVTGMMSSRSYIPFIAIEDTYANVTWAIQIETQGSWQIEAIHKYGAVSINGGLADFNYGHWRKIIKHGETFESPKAYITVVEGDLTKACAKLIKDQDIEIRLFSMSDPQNFIKVAMGENIGTVCKKGE